MLRQIFLIHWLWKSSNWLLWKGTFMAVDELQKSKDVEIYVNLIDGPLIRSCRAQYIDEKSVSVRITLPTYIETPKNVAARGKTSSFRHASNKIKSCMILQITFQAPAVKHYSIHTHGQSSITKARTVSATGWPILSHWPALFPILLQCSLLNIQKYYH